jgi:hypothetical protein
MPVSDNLPRNGERLEGQGRWRSWGVTWQVIAERASQYFLESPPLVGYQVGEVENSSAETANQGVIMRTFVRLQRLRRLIPASPK